METKKESDIPSGLKSIVSKTVERAANAVGVMTILSSIAVFGLSNILFGLTYSTWITVFYFGVFGTLEVFHIQKKSDLYKRLQGIRESNLVSEIAFAKRVGDPKVVQQINYRGFLFNGIGFEKLPITVGVSQPLCSKCGHPVIMDAKVKFPGRTKIRYFCLCGFEQSCELTFNELRQHAEQILNAPKKRAG